MFDRLPHLQKTLPKIVETIHAAHRILVATHCRPDGDAAGSEIAMGHILHALGKHVTVYNFDPIPETFLFLEGAQNVVHDVNPDEYDLLIVVDCGDAALIGKKFPYDDFKCRRIFIDHHSLPYQNCDLNLHDPKAAATGEIIFHLMNALGVQLTKNIAESLYTSIITDTGSYRYSSTTPDAMKISACLLETGIDVWNICSNIYENNPVEKIKLLGLVLQSLWLSDDGKIACLHATRDMLRACHCSGAMTDGFINYARSIHGVEVSIFLTQLEENYFRLSFRSRGNFDVSKIAATLGGGGHKNAAACTINGTIEDIRKRVETIVKNAWNEQNEHGTMTTVLG